MEPDVKMTPDVIEKQIQASLVDADDQIEQVTSSSDVDDEGQDGNDVKPIDEKTKEPEKPYQAVWDFLKGEKVEIDPEYEKGNFGEGKTEVDALLNVIKTLKGQQQQPQSDEDPFIQGYLQTPAEKRAEYIKQYNEIDAVLNYDAKAGLKYIYSGIVDNEGNRVYSDEDIDEYIEKQTKIALNNEWENRKGYIRENYQKAFTPKQPSPEEIMASIEKANTETIDLIKPLLADEQGIEAISGIPYTPEMKARFTDQFTKMNLINPKTGTTYLYEFLSDPVNLRNTMRGLVLLQDESIPKYLSEFKEDFKEKTFNKLDPRPKPKSGASGFKAANFPEP